MTELKQHVRRCCALLKGNTIETNASKKQQSEFNFYARETLIYGKRLHVSLSNCPSAIETKILFLECWNGPEPFYEKTINALAKTDLLFGWVPCISYLNMSLVLLWAAYINDSLALQIF